MSTFKTIQLRTIVDGLKNKTRQPAYRMSNGKSFYNDGLTETKTYLLDGQENIVYDGENNPVEVPTIYPEYVSS